MRLKCVARYRSGLGIFEPGQIIDGNDNLLGALLRDSPGSFQVVREKAEDISEALPTGLTVPDRRARGGRVR